MFEVKQILLQDLLVGHLAPLTADKADTILDQLKLDVKPTRPSYRHIKQKMGTH